MPPTPPDDDANLMALLQAKRKATPVDDDWLFAPEEPDAVETDWAPDEDVGKATPVDDDWLFADALSNTPAPAKATLPPGGLAALLAKLAEQQPDDEGDPCLY